MSDGWGGPCDADRAYVDDAVSLRDERREETGAADATQLRQLIDSIAVDYAGAVGEGMEANVDKYVETLEFKQNAVN